MLQRMKRDSGIEQQVLRSLKLNSAIASNEICVESNGGVVTLRGTVLNRLEKSAIYSAARQSSGVCRVVNKIEVKRARVTILEHSKNANRAVDRLGPLVLIHLESTSRGW
jgi:hypothetical protein